MNAPSRRAGNAAHILGSDQRREDVAHPAHEIATDLTVIVIFDQA